MSVGKSDDSAGFGLDATEAGGDGRKTLRRGQLLQERKVVVDIKNRKYQLVREVPKACLVACDGDECFQLGVKCRYCFTVGSCDRRRTVWMGSPEHLEMREYRNQ